MPLNKLIKLVNNLEAGKIGKRQLDELKNLVGKLSETKHPVNSNIGAKNIPSSEGKIFESAASLKAIIDDSFGIFFLLDINHRILHFNKLAKLNFEKLFQKTIQLGDNLDDYTPLGKGDMLNEYFNRCLQGEVIRFEESFIFPNGYIVLTENVFNQVFDENGQLLGISYRSIDITDRKNAEDQVRKSEEKYKFLFENSALGILTSDVNGQIMEVNSTLVKILGSPSAETTKQFNLLTLPTIVESGFSKVFLDCMEHKVHIQTEKAYTTVYGKKLRLHVNASPMLDVTNNVIGFYAIIEDITDKIQAIEKINVIEEKYQEIFEYSNDFIYTTDINGNFFSLNPYVETQMGYSIADLKNKNISEILSAESVKTSLKNALQIIRKGENQINYELEFLNRIGEVVFFDVSSYTKFEDGKPIKIFNIARDITYKKKAEQELREKDEKYKELFESTNDIIYTMDFEGNFTSVNPMAEKLLGLKFEKLANKNMSLFLTPESSQRARENIYKKLNERKENTTYEVDFIANNKNITFEINSLLRFKNGKPYEVFGIARDVTYRKIADKQLRESEEKYRLLIENIKDVIYSYDESGDITYVSPNAIQLFGYSSSELIGRNIMELVYKDDRELAMADFIETLENKEGKSTFCRVVKKNGEVVHIEENGKVITDSNNNIVLITGIIRDITERKLSEQQIKDALFEKDVLLREIHHRVKNNLQVIISLINIQMLDIHDKIILQKFKELQERIRTMSLVHEDLYMSENLACIEFSGYVQKLSSNLLVSYGAEKNTITEIAISNIELDIDTAIPCGMIINELISNSLKYAYPNDNERFKAKNFKQKITIEFVNDHKFCTLLVKDNGIGLPVEFDSLQSTSLGLRLVNILVHDQLNGIVEMKNNNGAEFIITFTIK